MVQIIPAAKQKYSFGSAVGQNFGEGLGQGMEESFDRKREDKYRKEEDEALKKRGIDLSGVRDPNTRAAIISNDLKMGTANKRADLSHNKDSSPNMLRKPVQEPSPTDQSINPRKIMTFDEQWDEASRIAQYKTKNGVPTSTEEVLPLIHARNEENRSFAQTQENYGNQAVEALYRHVSTDVANPDLEAKFRKFGEEEAEKAVSQSEFHKKLAEKVKNFKNAVVDIEKGIPAPRLFSNVKKAFLGTSRSQEEEDRTIRAKLKPLLDEGEYDIARTLLSKKGYGPEEIESKLSSLPEGTIKNLSSMPKIEAKKEQSEFEKHTHLPGTGRKQYNQAQKQTVFNTVDKVFRDDPSVNLILLRKAMSEKNVDWELFKDALDTGILNGSIRLNDEQRNQLQYTEGPPLDNLDKMLHGLNLIGE